MSEWLRNGASVYRLKHRGWKKGVEVMENETYLRVEGANAASVASSICDFLNSQPHADADGDE